MTSKRRKVLPEVEYSQTLGAIIREQYFPDIPVLESQLALQERRSAGDVLGAVAVRRATRRLQDHRESLKEVERQQEADTDEHGLRKKPRALCQESLTGFHERVISEDNAEFELVQRKEKREHENRRREYLLLSNATGTEPATLLHQQRQQHPLVDSPLPLASDLFDPKRSPVIDRHLPIEDALFFVPSAQHSFTDDSTTKVLMPPPSNRPPIKQSLVEYVPKARTEKKINPDASRFLSKNLIIAQRAHLEDGSDDDTSYASSTDASTDLDAPAKPLRLELRRAKRQREQDLEIYVEMTPLIRPDASPIMTWGRVGATPLALNRAHHQMHTESAAFSLPPQTGRDDAAQRALLSLDERARKAKSSSGRRLPANMSPAVAAMMGKRRSESARSASSLGTALRASYSQSVASSSKRSAGKRSRDHAYRATPQVSSRPSSLSVPGTKPGITDGLLRLP